MGRGVSSGGGQSSLGYLFGSGEPPKPAAAGAPKSQAPPTESNGAPQRPAAAAAPAPAPAPAQAPAPAPAPAPAQAPAQAPAADSGRQIPAGIQGNKTNNYFRADGQNSGNFLTDRPSTKVHAAPGGGSSLDYLFGGGNN